MQIKRHALTQIGDEKDRRRVYYRRDANCPVVAHVRLRDGEERTAVPCWLVNLSEDGCLLTSDHFPRRVIDAYIVIPGFGSKLLGIARNQGKYTVHFKFATMLTTEAVNKVARIKTLPKG